MADEDRIELLGLQVMGICGALPEERERPQPLEIDLTVDADLALAGRTDDLADTIDYGAICDAVVAVVEGGAPQLLEQLAADVAAVVLDLDERITRVVVTVNKLRPPVPHALRTSGVCIVRTR